MANSISFHQDGLCLYDDHGRVFEPQTRNWLLAGSARGRRLSLAEAVSWLQRDSSSPWRPPVGLIGPRYPSTRQNEIAEIVGMGIAHLGLTLLCGGRQGVMEAACRGAARAGGLTIGLLPDDHWGEANPFVMVPIATGIGVARNAILACASFCLIAIGGGYGTLSEIAYGLQFQRPVFGLEGAPSVTGVKYVDSWTSLEESLCRLVLNLEPQLDSSP
jgi:uncharacterized protein (TIGR00725 family)